MSEEVGGIEMRGPDHEEAMRLHAALWGIAHMTTAMPPGWNDPESWYRGRLLEAIGRADAALDKGGK